MNIEKDQELMKILKISEIRHLICQTNKGELALQLRFGEDKYTYVLDSVPILDDFINLQLHELLDGRQAN